MKRGVALAGLLGVATASVDQGFNPDIIRRGLLLLHSDTDGVFERMGVHVNRNLASGECSSVQTAIATAGTTPSESQCFMNLMCDVGKPIIDFLECLGGKQTATAAQEVFNTGFTDGIDNLCTNCTGKEGTDLDTCIASASAAMASSSNDCDWSIWSDYYNETNDPDGERFSKLFDDGNSDPTLAFVGAICDGGCYGDLYTGVQGMLTLMGDGTSRDGSCAAVFDDMRRVLGDADVERALTVTEAPTNEPTEAMMMNGSYNETTDSSSSSIASISMARGALRLLCAYSDPSDSSEPVSCWKTMEDLGEAAGDAETEDDMTTSICADKTLKNSGCCAREIMAGMPPPDDPTFWSDIDAKCGTALGSTDAATMTPYCTSAYGSVQSFVVVVKIKGESICDNADTLNTIIETTATEGEVNPEQVAVSSCKFTAGRRRALDDLRKLPTTGTSELGITVTAVGDAQIAMMDGAKTKLTSTSYSASIASDLGLASSDVSGSSEVYGELSAEGNAASAPRTAAAVLLAAVLGFAALIV